MYTKIEINPVLKLDHFPMAIEVKIEANMANDQDQGGISSIYKWRLFEAFEATHVT